MPIQTSTAGATSGNLVQNEKRYRDGVRAVRLYDQLASTMQEMFEPKGSTATAFWFSPLLPRPDTAIGNENADFDPQTFRDIAQSMTKAYYADGLKLHDLVRLKNSLNPDQVAAQLVGQLAMNTIDALARRKATEGALVQYGDGTVTGRSSLVKSTAAHHLSLANFIRVRSIMGSVDNGDEKFFAILDPWQYEDLLQTTAGGMLQYGGTGKGADEAIYNYEVGKLAGVRIIVAPQAKAFYGTGGTAATVSTSIAASQGANGSNLAGARTIEIASGSPTVGMWLTVGSPQTGAESDAYIKTEVVFVTGVSGTTISVTGKGAAGGLLYDHAVGEPITNKETVHCAVFGHSQSLAVSFEEYGRFGKLITPFQDGNAKQWTTYSFSPN